LSRYFEPRRAQQVLAARPDIVHFHSVHIPENVALAGCLRGAAIPYCVTVHGALFRHAMRRSRLKKAVFNTVFDRPYLNAATFIHAVSPNETDVIRGFGIHRPIVVVPNGLPPDSDLPPARPQALFERWPHLRGRRVFMFLGRLDAWQKGLDLLLEGFASARLPAAALILIGPDYRGARHRLTERAGRLGILSDVAFMEPAFGIDRANLFAAADVFVHPSRWEGLSLSVLAAAAAGKPCLITGLADPLGELARAGAAIIVEPHVGSIAAGLQRASALDRRQLQEMGRRARGVAADQFTWPSLAARLVAAYASARQ
jgi:glycosyltransferase involved in cell wall biosynthesis